MTSIYEAYEQYLPLILEDFTQKIKTAALEHKKTTSFKLYEHFHARIKTSDSMVEKCQRKNLPLSAESALPDCYGKTPGKYFIEVQLRTIAMDSWASLEHQMKYKHEIKNPERIERELKRCADELASCDLTMQTIRNLIQESNERED